jgi:hypothetical protein
VEAATALASSGAGVTIGGRPAPARKPAAGTTRKFGDTEVGLNQT